MKKMTIFLSLGVMSMVGAAVARNLVWLGSPGDSFANPGKWNIQDTPTYSDTPPGPDDKIVIGLNHPLTLDVTNDTDLGIVNGCLGICLAEVNCICNIVVPEGCDKSILVPIVGDYNVLSGSINKGTVNFSGTGTVRLCATNMYSYATKNFNVNGADVWLPQNPDLLLNAYNLGNITVTNGATLHMPTCHNGSLNKGANYVQVQRCYGDGTITASEKTEIRFGGSGGVFSGVLDTQMKVFSGGRQMLTGTNSTMTFAPLVFNAYKTWSNGYGTLGIMKFGKVGQPSSIGTTGQFNVNVRGGSYIYLGEGEESDKYLMPYGNADGYSVIDGGAHGGLVFTGNGGVYSYDSSTFANHILVGLSGSNTAACVFRGLFKEYAATHLLSVIKKGTGTWRFADPALDGLSVVTYRKFRGTISVDEGVLQFDTVAQPGEYCSVGRAMQLKGPNLGVWANMPDVDWAFSLGGTNAALNALAEGTLEYTGTKAGDCGRRRVRLEADGRFRANGTKRIRYCMAENTSARAKTLSLDGESTATNEVRGVSDTAEHPVSVVKEGGGTWLLGGRAPLHGDLKVKGGKLIVENYPLGSQYTWFKFTIKHLFDSVTGSSKGNTAVRFFGLYDTDGFCQTLDIREAEGGLAAAIEPGQTGYDTVRSHSKGGYSNKGWNNDNPTNLFRAAENTVFDTRMLNVSGDNLGYPRLSDESTWLPMVVRLTNGAPAIASYDWATVYGWTSGDKGGFHWMPCQWSLEGSVDGMHWENVKLDGGDYIITTNDCEAVKYSSRFIFSNGALAWSIPATPAAGSAGHHSGGCAIRGTSTNSYVALANVRSVQVDGGATLEIKGTAGVTFDSLTVDVSKGVGTINGGGFGASGMVQLENCPAGAGAHVFDCDLSGATGATNIADWSVKVNGVERSRWRVKYADGKLTILPPGTHINIR